ncbi:hypothetical protein LS74_010640 [Helicobacter magdeburgensis]|uniref:Uncharacterized protein n=1 Tax=Helicobacter magdeburgensis TaxID=471858 RepID=A0A4U8SVW6_9HELI|nr:hypothetical protein [Helicobacter magdeburgensis]TLD91035.1 hypothetical protein LS74_010640 [Helicobacter magdeburgensis]
MGFGDFAMGYLVGQSFSGPNHIPDGNTPYSEWSSQAKKDWDKKCDEAYWRAWDRAFKKEGIRRLRAHEKDLSFLTFRGEKLYPHISQDKEADLFESGEVRFIVFQNPSLRSFIWDDANREEAQNPNYLELQKLNKQDIESGRSFRVI